MSFKNRLVNTNYHTHMYLCRHASGTIEDYVLEAINLGFKEIGFTDHAPWDTLIDRSVRMNKSDYPIYLNDMNDAIKKYSETIKIYKGLEIEYFNGKDKIYEEYLKELDYLILGQHYIEMEQELVSVYRIGSIEELTIYKDTVIKGMKTGYFKILAHPDLLLFGTKELSKDILMILEEIVLAAKKYNVLLEINANGIRKGRISVNGKTLYRYPREEFFMLAKKHEAKCIISSDAHKPEYLYDEAIENAVKFSRRLGLIVEEELFTK